MLDTPRILVHLQVAFSDDSWTTRFHPRYLAYTNQASNFKQHHEILPIISYSELPWNTNYLSGKGQVVHK